MTSTDFDGKGDFREQQLPRDSVGSDIIRSILSFNPGAHDDLLKMSGAIKDDIELVWLSVLENEINEGDYKKAAIRISLGHGNFKIPDDYYTKCNSSAFDVYIEDVCAYGNRFSKSTNSDLSFTQIQNLKAVFDLDPSKINDAINEQLKKNRADLEKCVTILSNTFHFKLLEKQECISKIYEYLDEISKNKSFKEFQADFSVISHTFKNTSFKDYKLDSAASVKMIDEVINSNDSLLTDFEYFISLIPDHFLNSICTESERSLRITSFLNDKIFELPEFISHNSKRSFFDKVGFPIQITKNFLEEAIINRYEKHISEQIKEFLSPSLRIIEDKKSIINGLVRSHDHVLKDHSSLTSFYLRKIHKFESYSESGFKSKCLLQHQAFERALRINETDDIESLYSKSQIFNIYRKEYRSYDGSEALSKLTDSLETKFNVSDEDSFFDMIITLGNAVQETRIPLDIASNLIEQVRKKNEFKDSPLKVLEILKEVTEIS